MERELFRASTTKSVRHQNVGGWIWFKMPWANWFVSIGLVITLNVKEWIADIFFEYSLLHFMFVHWTVRLPISDRLFNSFRANGTNVRRDFSLFLLIFCDPRNKWPCKMWSGSKQPRLAIENVAPWRWISPGWMPERFGRYFVGVGHRNPVIMRWASFSTQLMRRMWALRRHQTGAQYFEVK